MELLENLYTFDCETHMSQPGLAAPPMVCAAVATKEKGSERLLNKDDALAKFKEIIKTGVISNTSLVYDLAVCAAEDPTTIPDIFDCIWEGRAYSTDILEALDANARGHIYHDPRNNAPLGRYSQAFMEEFYFGVDRTAEKEGGWRKKYALLEDLPISEWPDEAVQYPRRDARGAFNLTEKQLADGRLNLQCSTQEVKAAWMLKLACVWGMRTDPVMVPVVVGGIRQKHEDSRRKFFQMGIVRVRPCTKKKDKNTGISAYERADEITAEWLEHARLSLPTFEAWVPARIIDIEKAQKAVREGRPIRFATDAKRLKELVSLAYHGDPPMTAGGATGENPEISTSNDTLSESGDTLLEEYGEAGANEKLFSAFTKILEQGTRVPINPEGNSLVSSQRTSYSNPNLQQLPRKGLIRECFVPRGSMLLKRAP